MRDTTVERRQLGLAVLLITVAVFFLAWGGIQLTRENDRIAALWLANGLVVGILLRRPRHDWAVFLSAAAAGNLSANLIVGDPWWSAISLTAFNQVEIWTAASLILPVYDQRRRIDDAAVIRRLLGSVILACSLSACLASTFLHFAFDVPLVAVAFNWFLSDALGLLTVIPLVLAALERRRKDSPNRRVAPLIMLLGLTVSAAVMYGESGQPLLFTVCPIVFFAALRLNLLGALTVVCIISGVALSATLDGRGIIAAANPDPTTRMYILQLFMAVQLFTVLPIRALIAERNRLGQAAAESDRLFRRIAEASPAGIIHFDAVGRPTFVNGRWTQLTGTRFADLGEDGWLNVIDRPFRATARSLWSKARATDQPVVGEFPFLRDGVRAGWAELNIFPEIDGLRLLGFVARLTDVTARKEAEDALAERELLYRLVTENAHDVVLRLSADGAINYASSAIKRQFGLAPSEVVGSHFSRLALDEDQAAVDTILSAEQDLSEPVVQFRIRGGDGAPVWVEASYSLLTNGDPVQVQEIVVCLRDIDRRRQGEIRMAEASAKLTERNRLLSMAEELAEVGHWRHDLATGELDCSARTRGLLGLPADERPTAAGCLAKVVAEDRATLLRMIACARRSAASVDGPIRVMCAGELRHLRLGVQADFDAQGQPSGIFGVVRDKSEYVESQQELIRARDDAQAAAQAKSHFLATMSHEIRTPMTGVLGMIDLLREDPDGQDRDRYFATLSQSADLLMAVVDDVLDFSKIDSGALKLDSAPFDLKELVTSTVELFGNAASRKGLLLKLDVRSAGDGAVLGDPVRIQQITSNLLSNAIKFTSQGRVRITVSDEVINERQRAWSIQVSDTGIGIDKDEVGKLFQPFVQADGANARRFGGTGLGLAISRRLVEAMRGEIGVKSEAGRGSTFWVRIPLDDGSSAGSVEKSVAASGHAATKHSASLDLLVAEDNPVNQMLIGAILRKLGHRLTMVDNGRAAVEAAATHRYDAILMDMQMPEMDGLAATRAIRSSGGRCAGIPIIALTADASPERRRFYSGAGLSDFMTKPIDQLQLAARLDQIAIDGDIVASRSADLAS